MQPIFCKDSDFYNIISIDYQINMMDFIIIQWNMEQ